MRNAYKILVGKTKRKRPYGRLRQRWHNYLDKKYIYRVSEVGSFSVFKWNEKGPVRHSYSLPLASSNWFNKHSKYSLSFYLRWKQTGLAS
jgi:hypothetical protein